MRHRQATRFALFRLELQNQHFDRSSITRDHHLPDRIQPSDLDASPERFAVLGERCLHFRFRRFERRHRAAPGPELLHQPAPRAHKLRGFLQRHHLRHVRAHQLPHRVP